MKLDALIAQLQRCRNAAAVAKVLGPRTVEEYLAIGGAREVRVSGSGYATFVRGVCQLRRVDLGAAVEKFVTEMA